MKLSHKVKFARDYAAKKHEGQTYGEHPYTYHLDAVHAIVVEMGLGEEYEIAAYLHDILEDTDTCRDEMEALFGLHITEMVFAVSGFGASREERHLDMKDKMFKYPASINLKLADRLANCRSSKINKVKLFKTYQKEHYSLIPLFSQGLEKMFKELEKVLDVQQENCYNFSISLEQNIQNIKSPFENNNNIINKEIQEQKIINVETTENHQSSSVNNYNSHNSLTNHIINNEKSSNIVEDFKKEDNIIVSELEYSENKIRIVMI